MMSEYDPEIVNAMLENSWYGVKMRDAIWSILILGEKKATFAKRNNITRQHVTRTVNDFAKKYAKKLIILA